MEEKESVVGQSPPQPPKKGRRLAPGQGMSRGGKIAIAVVAGLVALLVGGYLGLCAYASGDRIMPGTVAGGMDLGGLTSAQAQAKLGDGAKEIYDALEIPVHVGEHTVIFQAQKAGVRSDGLGDQAARAGKEHFLASGWNYLSGLLGRQSPVTGGVTMDNTSYVQRFLNQVSAAVDQPVVETTWSVEETEDSAQVALTRGRTGQAVDQARVYEDLVAALAAQSGELEAQVAVTAPTEPDFHAMAAQIAREPSDASLDLETDEIIPHKLGLTADPQALKSAYANLSEGESAQVPLEVREPEITTLDLRSSLFRDILGEGSSKISGDANRVGNVRLAAAACNGVVLLPGEQMSYNKTTGQRTEAKGYRPASGYTAKGIEDMVGGGVCQPSSTLYLACLNADLEIVSRKNHMYTVSYMPEGMDATVSWPGLDYVFANNTPYPIKVVTSIENRVLTCRIYGTKTDDTYVKMESVRLSTTPAGVSYQADETVPQGTTTVLQAAHTGKKVQVYKNLYQGDGTLISRTLISTDTYRPGDKIIGYNPLDGAPDGSVPPVGTTDPGVTTDPGIDPGVTTQPGVDPAVPTEPGTDPGVVTDPATQPGEGTEPAQPAEPTPDAGVFETPVLPAMPVPAPGAEGIPAQ